MYVFIDKANHMVFIVKRGNRRLNMRRFLKRHLSTPVTRLEH